jgi:hypothetical protein
MRTETNRSTALREEIEGLRHMTTGQLKDKYSEVFGEASRSNHKQFLFRRIAWRIQANAWGGLSERARRRALEIADDADLRIRAPKNFLKQDRTSAAQSKRESRPRRTCGYRTLGLCSSGATGARTSSSAFWRTASSTTARFTAR